MLGHRRHRGTPEGDRGAPPVDDVVALDVTDATANLETPDWLRHLGTSSWLIAGVGVVLVGAVWIASLTQTIVTPVITAAVIASVMSPIVSWLQRHRVPRGLGAALLLLGVVAVGVAVTLVLVGGVSGETSALQGHLSQARQTITGWLTDLGVQPSQAQNADQDAASAISKALPTLLHGVSSGIAGLSSLAVFLSFTALSLFFLLKDGAMIRAWGERHMGVPAPLARTVSGRSLQSLRGYFLGVTIVAAFNAVVVGVGALVLGVPLAGTIAVITFVGAYIPYIGAWGAGAFSVLIALGGGGTDAAVGMIIIQLLANGILQQLLQPIAYGAALGIHPLAVLIVTIAGGSLFGAVGLILAAPVTSAVTRITADLRRARAAGEAPAGALAAPEAPA